MENAAEALLIAGGVLLGILTISAFVMMLGNVGIIEGAKQQTQEVKAIVDWNKEWEAYNKSAMYGTDALTIINKAKQNNAEYNGNADYQVTVEIEDTSHHHYVDADAETYIKSYVSASSSQIIILKCEEMRTSDKTGRINYIKLKTLQE